MSKIDLFLFLLGRISSVFTRRARIWKAEIWNISNNTRQNLSAEGAFFFIIARWLKFDHKRKYCRQKMCLRRPAFRVSFTMEVYLFLYVKVRCVQNRVYSRSRLTWPLSTYQFTESSVHGFVTVVFSNICFTNN